MIPQDSIHWLFWTGVGIALIGLTFGLWRAIGVRLLRLRDHPYRRCGHCTYDMRGTEGLLCPECGKATKNEQALHRGPAVPWKSGLVFLLVLTPIGAMLAAHRPLFDSPWPRHTPASPLLWLVNTSTEAGERAERELLGRWENSRLSLTSRKSLASHFLKGRDPMVLTVVDITGNRQPGLRIEAIDWTKSWANQWSWGPDIVHRLTHRVQPQLEGANEFAALFTARDFLLRLPVDATPPFDCTVIIEESGVELWRGTVTVTK